MKTGLIAALLISCLSTLASGTSYPLSVLHQGSSFFNGWDFYNNYDVRKGFVWLRQRLSDLTAWLICQNLTSGDTMYGLFTSSYKGHVPWSFVLTTSLTILSPLA